MILIFAAAAVVGAALLVAGMVRDARFQAREGGVRRQFVRRPFGFAWTLSFSDQMDVWQLKRALVDGSWRRDRRTQAFLLALLGLTLLIPGVFLFVGWLLRPIGLVAAIAASAYAVGRIVWMLARA